MGTSQIVEGKANENFRSAGLLTDRLHWRGGNPPAADSDLEHSSQAPLRRWYCWGDSTRKRPDRWASPPEAGKPSGGG